MNIKQLDQTYIGESQASLFLSNAVKDRLHYHIFYRQGDQTDKRILLVVDVCRNHAAHMLCCKFRTHFVLNYFTYLLKSIFSKPRVDLGNGVHGKVSESIAWKERS